MKYSKDNSKAAETANEFDEGLAISYLNQVHNALQSASKTIEKLQKEIQVKNEIIKKQQKQIEIMSKINGKQHDEDNYSTL